MIDFLDIETLPIIVEPKPPRDDGAGRDTRPPKPCCFRMRSADGRSSWCYLPDGHREDHHGLSAEEHPIAVNDYGPARAVTGAKK